MLVELCGILLLGGCAWIGGRAAGRASGAWWAMLFFVGMLATGLVVAGHRSARFSFVWPVSWAVNPHVEPLLMAVVVPLMFSVLIVRLKLLRQRVAVGVMTGAMFCYFACVPWVAPLMVRGNLLAGRTRMDRHGVCLQTHGYTCGPAAAVTCLRVLGIAAEEGALAVRARCGPVVGTDGVLLAEAVNGMFGAEGVRCEYRFVGSLDGLRTPAVATIVSPRYGGHYVAVMEVTGSEVIVGDPLSGRDRWTREEFVSEWTGAGHEFYLK